MKAIEVENRSQIKLLLSCDYILAVKDDRYQSFGGFQIWWYDHKNDLCVSCAAHWSDKRKTLEHHSLKQAAKILWQNKQSLFLKARKPQYNQKLQASYS